MFDIEGQSAIVGARSNKGSGSLNKENKKVKRTKECGNKQGPIQQDPGAEQGFDWRGAARVVLGPRSPSSRRRAVHVLAAIRAL